MSALGLRPALLFAGPADYVDCGDAPTGGLVALGVECWCRPDAIGTGNRPLVAKYSASAPTRREWALYLTLDGRLYFVVWDVSGGVSAGYSAAGAVTTGAWRHVRGCYDAVADRVRVFIDGVERTAGQQATGNAVRNTVQAVTIGGSLADPAIGFVGCIGPVRISSVCRSAYSVIPVRYPAVDANTVAQWNMAEGRGTGIDNVQGEAAWDGLIVGATWTHMPIIAVRSVQLDARPMTVDLAGRDRGLMLWPRTVT